MGKGREKGEEQERKCFECETFGQEVNPPPPLCAAAQLLCCSFQLPSSPCPAHLALPDPLLLLLNVAESLLVMVPVTVPVTLSDMLGEALGLAPVDREGVEEAV